MNILKYKKIILIISCIIFIFIFYFNWVNIEKEKSKNEELNIIVATLEYQDTIPIYSKPDINSSVIAKLSGQTCLTCNYFGKMDSLNNFVKVELSPELNGYVEIKNCSLDTLNLNNFGLNEQDSFLSQRTKVCQKSLTFLTTSYQNITCDTLIRESYKSIKIDFGDIAAAEYDDDSIGKLISKEELKPGDFVFYAGVYGGANTHLGLYLGKDYVIQSTVDKGSEYPLGGVHITKLNFRSSPTKYRTPFYN